MARAPKKCGRLDCPVLVTGRTYCPEHAKAPRSPSSLSASSGGERRRRAQVVSDWVASRGWWCPGYERPGHESRDLTAAHGVAVSRGGSELVGVLCRSCNSRQNFKPT